MSEYIPEEANRYWPKGDKVYIGSEKSIVRFIFYCTTFTEFELIILEDFKKFLRSQGVQSLPTFYCDEELLRTLLGCKFIFKKAQEAIQAAIGWRRNFMPNGYECLFNRVEGLLNSGTIYIHGRDHRYRPLIVLNAGKLDLNNYSTENYCLLLCYLLEFTVKNLMLPGHIENWIIITDLNNQSLHNLPMSDIKTIIKTLQDNFRCRMIVNYIVNAPRTLKFMWNIIKKFIEPHTVNKIRILRESNPVEMKNHFNSKQYEEKYGGAAPNATVFWPPILPTGPFETEKEEIGAHLEVDKLRVTETAGKNEEIFYSCAKSSLDEFYSPRNETEIGRVTVYHDAVSTNDRTSTAPYTMINACSSDYEEAPNKQKKCCEKCNIL